MSKDYWDAYDQGQDNARDGVEGALNQAGAEMANAFFSGMNPNAGSTADGLQDGYNDGIADTDRRSEDD